MLRSVHSRPLVRTLRSLVGFSLIFVAGCTSDPAFWAAVAQGLSEPVPARASVAPGAGFSSNPTLLLFGGRHNSVFLGCLNCNKYDSNSVLNPYGSFGSRYSSESIYNSYSEYGSRYSSYSACNPYATNPPVVVDPNGGYYGKLTINAYAEPIKHETLRAWLAGICGAR